MMREVVRKELLEASRDGRLRIMALLTLLLVTASGLSGYQQARAHAQAQASAQQHEQQRWLDQGEKHPHSAAHYGVYAFRPPGALAYFDPGLDPYLGVTVWMEAHWQNEPQYRAAQDAGPVSRFGQLTPATLLGALLPLLIFVAAAPAISAERESGTLRQLLAQGASPRHLVWGKAAASALLVSGLVLPLMLGFALLSVGMHGGGDALLRVALLTGLLITFVASMLMLALSISAIAGNARTALAALLAFWLLGTLVAPRLAMEWAEASAPTPSGVAFRQALRADLEDRSQLDEDIASAEAALLREHGVSSSGELPINFNGVRTRLADEHGYAIFDAHFGVLFDGYLRQEARYQRLGWVAPYLAWSAASSGLAGTDLRHFRHFIDAAEEHRRMIQDRMSEEMMRHPETDGVRYLADARLWAQIPEFAYQPPRFASLWHQYLPALLAPLAWFLIMLLALELAARRLRA
jgi:ABC-2 type transport system permease protein